MRVLVAGGAGFVGSHLCERLLADGHRVLCVDDLSTGRYANIAHLVERLGFEFRRHDVTEPFDATVDAVANLASPASPPAYLERPVETLLVNSVGTRHLLEIARRKAASFLLASTSEIYGEPLEHPQRESYWGNVNPNGMRSCYDEGKRFAEAMTAAYLHTHGVDARVVRIFNTYGPRSDPRDGRLVPNFITKALCNEPITVYGDGQQTRSLCYVSDLVDGLARVLTLPQARGGTFNLGSPREHTVLEYATMIRGLCGSTAPVVYQPLPTADDPTRRRPDITRVREILGWQPHVDLALGLQQTIDWFRGEIQAPTDVLMAAV
ncbi:MAG TPA: UDP-glucuronic acid decarboxylase family protein [Chloroflexota bacterium]|jgi:nucleoside-diphosphate-sugar epimerase